MEGKKDYAHMTQKWSSRPTTSDHTTRVRENQRRHRARTKAYINQLEEALAQANIKLEAALAKNVELEASLAMYEQQHQRQQHRSPTIENVVEIPVSSSLDTIATCQTLSEPSSPGSSLSLSEQASAANAVIQVVAEAEVCNAGQLTPRPPLLIPSNYSPPSLRRPPTPQLQQPSCVANSPVLLCGPVASIPAASYSSAADLPPSVPGESTISCLVAHRLIEQRNFKGLDLAEMQSRLEPGFRRAEVGPQSADGCRVDSRLVFELMDDITSA